MILTSCNTPMQEGMEVHDAHPEGARHAAPAGRAAAGRPQPRMRHLRAPRQLRAAGCGAVRRLARKPVRRSGAGRGTARRHLVAGDDPRHDQVHPLPALRRHVPLRPGGRRAGDHRHRPRHLRRPEGRPIAEGVELRDLRAMRAGLPDRRARRARRNRQGGRLPLRSRDHHGGAVRPRHPRRLRRGIRPAVRNQRAGSDHRRLPQARLRHRARHQFRRRRGDHGGRHGAARPARQGPSADLHLVLPGLDQLRRTALSGDPAAAVDHQVAAAVPGRHRQDLSARTHGARPQAHPRGLDHAVHGQEGRNRCVRN